MSATPGILIPQAESDPRRDWAVVAVPTASPENINFDIFEVQGYWCLTLKNLAHC